ncbi:MAG TPA: polyprenyl diphosphate synthase, partial [Kofleriaceae bacterium]|nr:polyprenyl diphosphate synthase [Kofleriaceae bacterium]
QALTAHGTGLNLCLALNYGAHDEILDAARRLAAQAAARQLDPDAIDPRTFEGALFTAGMPPVDLLIRTSGEQRISNFMLWEIAYAELVFVEVLWPEFRRTHLHACLETYAKRERRFGLTSAQLAEDV